MCSINILRQTLIPGIAFMRQPLYIMKITTCITISYFMAGKNIICMIQYCIISCVQYHIVLYDTINVIPYNNIVYHGIQYDLLYQIICLLAMILYHDTIYGTYDAILYCIIWYINYDTLYCNMFYRLYHIIQSIVRCIIYPSSMKIEQVLVVLIVMAIKRHLLQKLLTAQKTLTSSSISDLWLKYSIQTC